MNRLPQVSVIIPTHNRCEVVQRALSALERQTYPLDRLEVVVVADGCTDRTVETLGQYHAPLRLRTLEQAGQGPGAARNSGAASAGGELLVFLDDDVNAEPGLIEAHVRAHENAERTVVVGPYLPVIPGSSWHETSLRDWWNDKFERLGRPGLRHTYASLLSGNVSIRADLFSRIGGFDPVLRAHEDYEFGIRLVLAGVRFKFAADAVGQHFDRGSFASALERKRQEGLADVAIARRFPALIPTLPFGSKSSVPARVIRGLAYGGFPARGCTRMTGRLLEALEHLGWRGTWNRVDDALSSYWYWRGVAEATGSRRALFELTAGNGDRGEQAGCWIEIDLQAGLEAAERRLDEVRPSSVSLRFGPTLVGAIPFDPAAERLHGGHLRPYLVRDLASGLLEALAAEGAILDDGQARREALSRSLRLCADSFGPPAPGKMWWEQYSQWHHFENKESSKERTIRERWEHGKTLLREIAYLYEKHRGLPFEGTLPADPPIHSPSVSSSEELRRTT